MSRIKAGLELAVELKEEEQLEEIQTEPTEETVEEFQEETLEDTIAEIDESFAQSLKDFGKAAWRDFGPSKRADDAGSYFKHLAQKYAGSNRTLSAYYSIKAGNTPNNIEDPETFMRNVERNVPLKMQIDRDLKDAKMSAQMNELKKPVDYHDDDPEEYLRTLNPKTVKQQYKATLPKGHTNLYKKFKQLKEISDEDDGNLYTFRVLCTLKDYGHTMVSKRGEDIMKTVRVTAATSNEAVSKAKRHYKMKGYEVMDAEVVGKLPASGNQINEDYESRVDQIAKIMMSRMSYPWTKEDLARAIISTAWSIDAPDVKLASTKKELLKDVYKKIKPYVKWKKAATAAPAKPKVNLAVIGHMIMDTVSQTFPDGDPLDVIVPKLRKMGINTDAGVEPLLDKALKSIGYKGGYYNTLADFWDEMKAQVDYDAQHGHQSHLNLGDRNPWRIKEAVVPEAKKKLAAKDPGFKKVTWDQFEGLASDSSDYEETTANGHRIWVIWNGPNCIGSFYTKEGYGTYNPNFKGDDVSYNESDPYYPQSMMEAGETTNPKDKVTLDIPLLIRLLEYAREDAKTDMDLHDLTEKLIALGSEEGRTLSMKDYDQLVSNNDAVDEGWAKDAFINGMRRSTALHIQSDQLHNYADDIKKIKNKDGARRVMKKAKDAGHFVYPPRDITKDKSINEAKNPAMHRAKLIAKMQKNAPSFKAAMAKKDKDKEEVKENNRSNRLDDLYDREMRKLDKELEAGHITQAEYNKQARNLNRELEDEDNEQLNEVYVIHKVKGNSSTQLPKISFKTKKEAKSHVDDRMAKRSEYDKEQGIKFEYRKNKMGGLKPERIEAAKKIGKK